MNDRGFEQSKLLAIPNFKKLEGILIITVIESLFHFANVSISFGTLEQEGPTGRSLSMIRTENKDSTGYRNLPVKFLIACEVYLQNS